MHWWILRRQLHVSWLIAVFSSGIVIGVILVQFLPPALFSHNSWLIIALLLGLFGFWKRRVYVILLLIIAGVVIGLWRGSPLTITMTSYKKLTGYIVTVQGNIREDPEIDARGNTVLKVEAERIEGHERGGVLWVTTKTHSIKRGDTVTLRGKVDEGFGTFAASMFNADITELKRPQPGDVAGGVRDWFSEKVRTVIPDPEASLGLGYLVGQRSMLPPELDEALKVAGLTHIVVASGYNLTILVRFARRIFVKVSKYLAALTAGGMIVGFMAITGMSPSMSRAGLVAGLSLLAWYYGRKFHPLILLPFAAAITLLVEPSFGWNDLGWQLSFAAFAGVMAIAPLMQAYFFGKKKPGTIRQILGETIAAQLMTLPILIVAFGEFSNVALLANLLVLPLVPLAMLLTFLSGIIAWLMPMASIFIAGPTTALLSYMIQVATTMAELPWAQTHVTMPPWIAAIIYAIIAIIAWWMWRQTRFNLRTANLVE